MGTDSAAGSIGDLGGAYGYCGELSPALIDFVLLLRGFEPPQRAGARYLELGVGQGLSLNIHAAATPGRYWGVDADAGRAAAAEAMARRSEADCRLSDAAVGAFAARDDLPEFDYIVLHEAWSGIGDAERDAVCDLVRRRLRLGGVFYVDYDVLPGAAAADQLRALFAIHQDTAADGDRGADAALAFAGRLAEAGARYFTATPAAAPLLQQIAGRGAPAQACFERGRRPMYFAEICRRLAQAKLSFAASTALAEQVEALNLTDAQRRLVAEAGHPVRAETIRDHIRNQPARRDLFVRGARRLSAAEQRERLDEQRLVLAVPPAAVPMKVLAALGELTLREDVYRPLLSALAEDGGRPKSIGDLSARPALQRLTRDALMEAVALMVGLRHVLPAQSPEAAQAALEPCARLTRHIVELARVREDIGHLPSPVAGAGVPVPRIEQLFLREWAAGERAPRAWADGAWAVLREGGQRLVKQGQAAGERRREPRRAPVDGPHLRGRAPADPGRPRRRLGCDGRRLPARPGRRRARAAERRRRPRQPPAPAQVLVTAAAGPPRRRQS
ncbi:MAG: methyltransferase regulatory domain-containing protein [Caulobacteraceae bacterium]